MLLMRVQRVFGIAYRFLKDIQFSYARVFSLNNSRRTRRAAICFSTPPLNTTWHREKRLFKAVLKREHGSAVGALSPRSFHAQRAMKTSPAAQRGGRLNGQDALKSRLAEGPGAGWNPRGGSLCLLDAVRPLPFLEGWVFS